MYLMFLTRVYPTFSHTSFWVGPNGLGGIYCYNVLCSSSSRDITGKTGEHKVWESCGVHNACLGKFGPALAHVQHIAKFVVQLKDKDVHKE